ncbi:MAG: hypothetical protein ACW986_06435 [Promethearchaeota archaeon]|jgi:hypothetical protein
MRKGKVIGLSLICTLLILSTINMAQAQTPSYVGIDADDSYVWLTTVNMASVNTTMNGLIGADNWSMVYDMLNEMAVNASGYEISDYLGAGIKADISSITPEGILFPGTNGVAVYANISVAYEIDNWVLIANDSNPIFMIADPAGLNETTFMYYLFPMGPPLFLAKGINFNQVATWISAGLTGMPPLYNNITITGVGDGFRFTILGDFLEDMASGSGAPFPIPTLGNIVATVRWNANGVLSLATLAYDGLTLVTLQLIGNLEEIPGYMLPILLGASIIGLIGTISIVKRKKRVL